MAVARRAGIGTRLAAAVAVAGALAAGIIVLGRLASSDGVAAVLTGGWFALVAAAVAVLWLRRRELLLAAAAGWAVTAVVAGVLLGLPMLTEREVNEDVASAAPPATPSPTPAPAATGQRAATTAPRNVELARGGFTPIAHPGRGTARLIELGAGGRVLTLTGFATDNGPDLRLYLATGDPAGGGSLGRFVDLGALKGNRGNQQYRVPAGVDAGRYRTVVVWCRAFSVAFTSARLA